MKGFHKYILIGLLTPWIVFAQIDTTLKDYFPMATGNIWEYEEDMYPDYWHYQIKIIGDTIMPNSKKYFTFYSPSFDKKEYYRIDDSLNIYYFDNSTCNQKEILKFKLNVEDKTIWEMTKITGINCGDTVIGSIGLYQSFVQIYPKLSLAADTKLYTEVIVEGNDTIFSPTVPQIDFVPTRLARGIGLIWTQFEGPAIDLVGAIINGKKIGSITSIKKDDYNKQIFQDVEIQNYPNPFNLTTTITVQINRATHVQLSVFNILGQEINRLAEGFLESGIHRFYWNGKTSNNVVSPSGVYFCLLHTDNASKIITINLIK
jgi:hypothetical protein